MVIALDFDQLITLAPRLGITDAPCPLCATARSARGARRPVLRIWRERDFAGFACARCYEKGWARSGGARTPAPSRERLAKIRSEAAERQAVERAARVRKARWMWSASRPTTMGSPPLVYLREARSYHGPIPLTLRYLAPHRPDHHPAMIAAFGIADEPEPGVVTIHDDAVQGVHVTLLRPDGSGKAEIEDGGSPKLMVGPSNGWPICLAGPNDLLGLAVTEGIEDALSIHEATGLGAWAAGSAGRLPKLANKVPGYVEAVTIAAHPDPAGERGARDLADTLTRRGIDVVMQGLAS